jgi:hypothetical protein
VDVKTQVESAYEFDSFVYHLRKSGGHVAALHHHRQHHYFARADLSDFFYSIARNRVQRALAEIGIARARHYAKWSCVKNPLDGPSYALPYGFKQSPILATLVLLTSGVGAYLRELDASSSVAVSMYVDDISLSSDDEKALSEAFGILKEKIAEANFQISPLKIREPATGIDLFNCDLRNGSTFVRPSRIEHFYSEERSELSVMGFENYRASVSEGNSP